MSWKKIAVFAIPAFALTLGAAGGARADLAVNGGFEATTGFGGNSGQVNFAGTINNWSVTGAGVPAGYTWLYAPGGGTSGTQADTGPAPGQFGTVLLWGPGTGSNNGLTKSPDGGNFVALDPDFKDPNRISQTINGLTAGSQYTVSFFYAGSQQSGFDGATTEGFDVSLGGQTISAPTLSNVSHGFTGWKQASLIFTATGSSELLSFLATGTGGAALPPFVLLDGVHVNAVPEPSTLVFIGTGLLGVGAFRLYRRGKSAAV